jgi:putative FmdB family regulatory protein
MPTYQYACTDSECGNRFELVQSFTDPAVSECPVCAGPVRKVYSAVGVVFKGSGFYRTDSRAAANGSDSAKKSESKSDSKTDSKPDSKTDSKPKTDSKSGAKSESSSSPARAAASA